MLVRDAREQLLRQPVGVVDQGAGEEHDGPGQRSLLRAFGLIAAIEKAVEQFRMLAEHALVETLGNSPDVLADDRQRRLDNSPRALGEHCACLTAGTVHSYPQGPPRDPW